MNKEYNMYCDESCHLEHDNSDVMVLGTIYCEKSQVHKINTDIKKIKLKHNLSSNFEIKWTKISNTQLDFYKELISYFFDNPYLKFRGVIAKDKHNLNHEEFNQTHDEWYYKMYYFLLREPVHYGNVYNIYLDIKDTNGGQKKNKLQEILNGTLYDFAQTTVKKIQLVQSKEINILQLTDLLIGCLEYENRNLNTSTGKLKIVQLLKELSSYNLSSSTAKSTEKFNIFVWKPQTTQGGI